MLVVVLVLGTDLLFTAARRALASAGRVPQPVKFRVQSEVYHHGFEPRMTVDQERWGVWTASYRINSLGFRDSTVREVPLRSGRRRVVFIGDSFTEGVGVEYPQTYVGLADAALSKQGIEVLNAGVASYSPIFYYRRVKHLIEDVGLTFDALVVFIDIGDIQDEVTYKLDEAGNIRVRGTRRVSEVRADRRHDQPVLDGVWDLGRGLKRHTTLLGWAWEQAERRMRQPAQRSALWTVDDQVYEQYGREGVENAQRHMTLLAELLGRHGIALNVGVYPWPDQVLLRDLDSRQARVWREWARQHGAGFLSCFPRFVDTRDPRRTIDQLFIPGDIHWNEAGHRVIAELFLERFDPATLKLRDVVGSTGGAVAPDQASTP